MDTHDNLTPAQERDVGSVWRDTPTHEPSGQFKEDEPPETLNEAMRSRYWTTPSSLLDVCRFKETGKRGDDALHQLSWASRSVLELPHRMQDLIARLPSITEKMEYSLAEYQRFASTNDWDTSKLPSELLASALADPRASKVPQISTVLEGFGQFERDLLKAAFGLEQEGEPPGPTRLEQTLSYLRETRDLQSDFMLAVCQLSLQTEALKSFESLMTDPGVMNTLRSATEILSQLKGPIVDHWSPTEKGYQYRWKVDDPYCPYDPRRALKQGKLHSAVISLVKTNDGRTVAEPILERALDFVKSENHSLEPKPSQVINKLHHLMKEVTSTSPYWQTMEVFTRFCELIKANPTTPALDETPIVTASAAESAINAENCDVPDIQASSGSDDVNAHPASDLELASSAAPSLGTPEKTEQVRKDATDSNGSWDSQSSVESGFSELPVDVTALQTTTDADDWVDVSGHAQDVA